MCFSTEENNEEAHFEGAGAKGQIHKIHKPNLQGSNIISLKNVNNRQWEYRAHI